MEHTAHLKTVFFGTPGFASHCLQTMINAGVEVVAVVTAPDRPAGRGKKLQASDVKKTALENNLPVLQPTNLKDPSFLELLSSYQPEVAVVVAFRMLPKSVWSLPTRGTFNLHASLLPNYRGAAPINWAIINGETETGVTTFFIDEAIDTGNILLTEKVAIASDDNAGTLHDKLMTIGGQLIVQTLQGLANETLVPKTQKDFITGKERHAPKIFKEDCYIHWDASATDVVNHIRGMSPYPAARTTITIDGTDKLLKIFRATAETSTLPIGDIETDFKSYLKVGCGNGLVQLDEVQLEGRKRVSIKEFLNANISTLKIKA